MHTSKLEKVEEKRADIHGIGKNDSRYNKPKLAF